MAAENGAGPITDEFLTRVRREITKAEHVSLAVLHEIERELQRQPSAALWILRGDAIQLSDGEEYNLEEAETSYVKALQLDPKSADAYESLGHFIFAVRGDAQRSIQLFRRAIELGGGASARDGLRAALADLAEDDDC